MNVALPRLMLLLVMVLFALPPAPGAALGDGWPTPSSIVRTLGDAPVIGAQVDPAKIMIRDAWVQEGPPSQKITAAFMVIENHTSNDLALISATTGAARVVELHKIELENEMMRMRRVDQITIPAEGKVELKPGGYHLMVIGLNRELKEGDEVSLTLRFAGSIEKTLSVPVRKRNSN